MMMQSLSDFVKYPMFVPFAAIAVVLVLLLLKFAIRKNSLTSNSLENSSKAGKKKKAKKQRPIAQDKKNSDSPKARKDNRKNEISSFSETKKHLIEEEKNNKKKDGSKSKGKSKKKKNSNQMREVISEPITVDNNFDEGEWKTVSTKEQREQIKREKRKLEETTALSIESATEKSDPIPLVQPAYKPTHNPAIAKGIAPRFARAAGAEWQEKPSTFPAALPLSQSKRPMPPATVPGTVNPLTKPSTVTQQKWNQGNQSWQQDGIGWSTSVSTTIPSNLISYLQTNGNASLLSLAQPSEKKVTEGWTPTSVSWQNQGTVAVGSTTSWEVSTEDWVHVNGQNGRKGSNNATESWRRNESPIQTKGVEKEDVWTFEPEGFSMSRPQIEETGDPWGMEVIESETGDWSAPKSSWDNANAEWTAPSPVKSKPTYIDESSDEDVALSKVTSNQANSSAAAPQSVVGASPEFVSQASAAGQNKKSRRRRKKKQIAATEPEQLSSPEVEAAKIQPIEVKPEEPPITKDCPSEEVVDDWNVPKVLKKRKNKARKAD